MSRAVFFTAALWISLAFLASRIEKDLRQGDFTFTLENSFSRILGSAKEVVGDTLFLKADSYFHGGIAEKFDEHDEDLTKEGFVGGEAEKKTASDWIGAVNERIQSHEHSHLAVDKRKEMLPFLALSISLDPHNIEAILSTAYWLDSQFGKTDEAIRTLEKGTRDNPDSWELERQTAELYLLKKHDAVSAERHYRAALKRSETEVLDAFERLNIYYHLGDAFALQKKNGEAGVAYRSALEYMDPQKPLALAGLIREKIDALNRE